MIWEPCDTGEKLRDELKDFLGTWLVSDDYKSRLPRKHLHILKQGEKQGAGINVIVVTDSQPDDAWIYKIPTGDDAGRTVSDENHRIALVIKADKAAGGRKSISPVHSILRSIFACAVDDPEKVDLISRGVYNLFEATDGLQVESTSDDDEGVFMSQQLNLVCQTSTFNKVSGD